MAEQFTIPTPGDTIAGKYLIEEELGRGSYGVVFRARQLGLNRDVALKTLLPQAFLQSEIVSRFQREASLISRLQHPNIVTLYDFGEADDVLYMAMEFVRGRSLSQVMKDESPMPGERAAHIIIQVLVALSVAHREGIVHRDLKPENIIICEDDDGVEGVKVLDFGIAKLTRGDETLDALKTLTIEGYVLGTPHYMSPELISGDPVTNRADLYAVGILLYELLAGKHPFQAPTPSSVLIRHLNDPVPPLPDPGQQQGRYGYAIRRALEKDPEDRVDNAATLIQILNGEISPPVQRWRWLLPGVLGLFALVALLSALAVGGLLLSQLEPTPTAKTTEETTTQARPETKSAPKPNDMPAMTRAAAAVATSATQLDAARKGALRVSSARTKTPNTRSAEPTKRNDRGTKDAPTVSATTRLRLVSTPSGAQVTVNGRAVGTTPCSHTIATERAATVSFRKIGFRPASMNVKPKGGSQTVSVTLRPGRIKLAP